MLEETGLPYEPHRIDILKGENHDPAFLALNPNGKIPAIYDPDGPSGTPLALFESGAIRHFGTKLGTPRVSDFTPELDIETKVRSRLLLDPVMRTSLSATSTRWASSRRWSRR